MTIRVGLKYYGRAATPQVLVTEAEFVGNLTRRYGDINAEFKGMVIRGTPGTCRGQFIGSFARRV